MSGSMSSELTGSAAKCQPGTRFTVPTHDAALRGVTYVSGLSVTYLSGRSGHLRFAKYLT